MSGVVLPFQRPTAKRRPTPKPPTVRALVIEDEHLRERDVADSSLMELCRKDGTLVGCVHPSVHAVLRPEKAAVLARLYELTRISRVEGTGWVTRSYAAFARDVFGADDDKACEIVKEALQEFVVRGWVTRERFARRSEPIPYSYLLTLHPGAGE